MRSARWVLGSAPVLVAALVAASAAAGAVKISAGQEFVYSGTASWKAGSFRHSSLMRLMFGYLSSLMPKRCAL